MYCEACGLTIYEPTDTEGNPTTTDRARCGSCGGRVAMTDYSKSRYENAIAEEAADLIAFDGAEDSIMDADGTVLFDLVRLDGGRGRVIVRWDAQGFVWVERHETLRDPEHDELQRHWDMLRREYAEEVEAE